MSNKDFFSSTNLLRVVQIQQIYVHKLMSINDSYLAQLEEDLVAYFSLFGRILDKRILRDGLLSRPAAAICEDHVSGGGDRARNYIASAPTLRPASSLTRF